MCKPILRIDKKYRDTADWNKEKDEFNKMFRFSDGKGIQNSGGFRYKSKFNVENSTITNAAFVLLISNFSEPEWPDHLNLETGIFKYFGDNRKPGTAINDTHIGGNSFLEFIFENLHSNCRDSIPPILCFKKIKDPFGSYMKFLGLAVPGAQGISSMEDLVAVWRVQDNKRFQNYRAFFTILEEEVISWQWLSDLCEGIKPNISKYCPKAWKDWVENYNLNPLKCQSTFTPRSKSEQLPENEDEKHIINCILNQLTSREFEYASKDILKLLDNKFWDLTVTRNIRDGGVDIIGKYKIGHLGQEISLDIFAEAKHFQLGAGVGVKPMARLISRIKHRDLGIFITTTYFTKYVQKELYEDEHPILLISGKDIARILINNELGGKNNKNKLSLWLQRLSSQAKI